MWLLAGEDEPRMLVYVALEAEGGMYGLGETGERRVEAFPGTADAGVESWTTGETPGLG